jgi:uncharacterized iron-regulated membrane protein
VFYALCTLVGVLAPATFLSFMNSLFHGMNFSGMVQQRLFSWSAFLVALLLLSGWALLAGTFFAWLRNRLADRSALNLRRNK